MIWFVRMSNNLVVALISDAAWALCSAACSVGVNKGRWPGIWLTECVRV
jgi:hypothetical protein